MTTPVWRHILRGIKSIFVTPPVGTGGTVSAQYCYSVYLRHLVVADQHGLATDPCTVVELGPGDSIGIGLMALLTGAEQYYAVDAVRHASSAMNLRIFDELAKLLMAQAPIPSGREFTEILPGLSDYSFPSKILSKERLTQVLAPDRPWFINRQPCSMHLSLVKQAGFSLCAAIKQFCGLGISSRQLADRFKELTESDLITAGVLVLASKTA